MEPTEKNIIAELSRRNREWVEHFGCKTLEDFVKVHPEWQDEFEVAECIVNIPDELQCPESTGEYPCVDCPLQLSVKKPLWTMGNEPERKGKPRKFGHGSTAGHLDETNI